MSSTSAASSASVELSSAGLPLLRADPSAGESAAGWAAEHRGAVRAAVAERGRLLIRGLGLASRAEAGEVFGALGTPMEDREPFAPRERHAEGVYSATRWPPGQQMCMHHELSYALEFPGLMMFACLIPPAEGGATAVADSPTVLEAVPASLLERFEREGWLLVRNYNEDIGASVAEAFGTDDPEEVERHCRDHAISYEWRPDGGLRTWQRRSAVIRHPLSGRRCWFNQIAFLNAWTIDAEVREYLVEMYGEDGLPFDTRYGGGERIGEDVVALLNATYEAHTLREPWQGGDLLLVDNVRSAHSREAFSGPREVVVALADPVRLADCSPTVEATPA